jgi:hypothetical protein
VRASRLPKSQPGYNEQFEVGTKPVVDPESAIAERVDDGEYKLRHALCNMRETPIAHLRHRGQIDDLGLLAADRFRETVERAFHLTGTGVIDPAKIRVDVSRGQYSVPDRAIDAMEKLKNIRADISGYDYALLVEACWVGTPLGEIMRKYTPPEEIAAIGDSEKKAERATTYIGHRIRDALGVSAIRCGRGSTGASARWLRMAFRAIRCGVRNYLIYYLRGKMTCPKCD